MKGLSDEKAFEETTTSVADNADVATNLRSAKKEKLKSLNKKERSKEKESPSKRKKKQRKNKSKNAKEKCHKDGRNYKKEKKKSRKNEDTCVNFFSHAENIFSFVLFNALSKHCISHAV